MALDRAQNHASVGREGHMEPHGPLGRGPVMSRAWALGSHRSGAEVQTHGFQHPGHVAQPP